MTGDKTDVTALVKYAQSLEAEIERLRAALKTIAENSHDEGACAWAWGALMKMKPAAHEQRADTNG